MDAAIEILSKEMRKLKLEIRTWSKQGNYDVVDKINSEIRDIDIAISELLVAKKKKEQQIKGYQAKLTKVNDNIKRL